jgi:hypothetical protein
MELANQKAAELQPEQPNWHTSILAASKSASVPKLDTTTSQCFSTALAAKNDETASPSAVGAALSPIFSSPTNPHRGTIDSVVGTTGGTQRAITQSTQPPTRRRTLASLLRHPLEPNAEVADNEHCTDELHARLPQILTETGHSEMFGVPLVPAIVGMEPDIPTRIVLNKFLRANLNDIASSEKQLRAALV